MHRGHRVAPEFGVVDVVMAQQVGGLCRADLAERAHDEKLTAQPMVRSRNKLTRCCGAVTAEVFVLVSPVWNSSSTTARASSIAPSKGQFVELQTASEALELRTRR